MSLGEGTGLVVNRLHLSHLLIENVSCVMEWSTHDMNALSVLASQIGQSFMSIICPYILSAQKHLTEILHLFSKPDLQFEVASVLIFLVPLMITLSRGHNRN